MISKLRQIIACSTSIFLIILSLGFFKPNFYGKFNISDPTCNDKSEISLGVEKDADLKDRVWSKWEFLNFDSTSDFTGSLESQILAHWPRFFYSISL